jgi:uracil-DNA glycosylase family 4
MGTPEQIVNRCITLGRKAVCITDHDNVFAHPQLQIACKKNNVKPIFGCEMRMVEDIKDNQRSKNHITILTKNYEGYVNLMKLVTTSYREGNFYYRPTIDKRMLLECHDGLIVLSGCPSGMLSRKILDNDLQGAMKLVSDFKNTFGDDYYLEVMAHDMDEVDIIVPTIRAISNKYGIKMVLTNDEHCLEKGQERLQKILWCIRDRETFKTQPMTPLLTLYYMTDDEMFDQVCANIGKYLSGAEIQDLFNNQERIASDCNVVIPKAEFIKYGVEDPYNELKKMATEGLTKKGLLNEKEYLDRLDKELTLVNKKNFSNYFLVVADIVNWAKGQNIFIGPSRGSSACSLLAYLISITEVDPIKYGLPMERFMSEDRIDPPDIDVDFQDSRRQEVVSYISKRFGSNNVSQLATAVEFKGRNTLQEIGKVFSIPPSEIKAVQNTLVTRGSADARASATIEDTFKMFPVAQKVARDYPEILDAKYFEGQIRHTSVHAAGVIVSDHPLYESTAVLRKNGVNIAMLTGDTCSKLGLLKMDILGLNYLSILNDLCACIGIDPKSLYTLPLDDKETIDIFNGSTVGIFQFNEQSTHSVGRQLGIDEFYDIVLATSLSRPGPLHCVSGEMEVYDCDKQRRVRIEEAFKDGIKHTLGLYSDGQVKEANVRKIFSTGQQRVHSLKLKGIKDKFFASAEHRFMVKDGWKQTTDLRAGDEVAIYNGWPSLGFYGGGNIVFCTVTKVSRSKIVDTYDMEVDETHNYIVGGAVSHNSGNTELITRAKKSGQVKVWEIDIMNEITAKTYGYVVFQEQVIKIMHEVGGFEWKDVTAIRSAMSKSLGDEYFNTFRNKFVEGSGELFGISQEYANEIFDHTSTFGCVAWNTLIFQPDGNKKSIEELYHEFKCGNEVSIPTIDPSTGKVIFEKPLEIVYSGKKPTYFVRTWRYPYGYTTDSKYSGRRIRTIRATLDHKFLTSNGEWKKVEDLINLEKNGLYEGQEIDRLYVSREYGSNDYAHYSAPIKDRRKMASKFLKDGKSWNNGLTKEDPRVKIGAMRSLAARVNNNSVNDWGYGIHSIAADGHFCQSSFEAEFEKWMLKNNISHVSHPLVRDTTRPADYLIGEKYIELDGMQPRRTNEYWNEKYQGELSNLIIIYPENDFDEMKDKIFECVDPEPFTDGKNLICEICIGTEYACDEDTYDIIMRPEQPNFIADGFVVHNSWAFNLAHAVGYSIISYWTAYFKAHYPREFYKVLCSHAKSQEKLREILREYKEKGFGEILPPKIGKSELDWKIEKNDLRAGLLTVLPEGAAGVIRELYPIVDMNDLQMRAPRRKVNSRVISLIELNEMFNDNDAIDPFGLYAFAERLSYTPRTIKIGDLGYNFDGREATIAGVLNEQINLKSLTELQATQKLRDWTKRFDQDAGDEWCILPIVDDSGVRLNCHVKNKIYPQYRDMLWSKKVGEDILIVKGYIPGSTNYMIVNQIDEWNDRKALDAKCYKCSLIRNQFCPHSGSGAAKIVFVGMCPGKDEIREQRPFVGRAGQKLQDILDELQLDRDNDLYITNSSLCRPVDADGANMDPDEAQLACCSDRLRREISEVNPKVVVSFGGVAYYAVTGEHPKSITEIAGTKMQMENYVLIPSIHPAASLRPGGERYLPIIKDCIRQAIEVASGDSGADLDRDENRIADDSEE